MGNIGIGSLPTKGEMFAPLPYDFNEQHHRRTAMERIRLKKLCECGCGQAVKAGNRFVHGHNSKTEEMRMFLSEINTGRKQSPETIEKKITATKGKVRSAESIERYRKAAQNRSPETLEKLSKAAMGHPVSEEVRTAVSAAHLGKELSDEHKMHIAIGNMRPRRDGYCDAWSDQEYKADLCGTACERCGISFMMQFKLFGGRFVLHHADADKMNCHPENFMTVCRSCHTKIHNELRRHHNGI